MDLLKLSNTLLSSAEVSSERKKLLNGHLKKVS